MNVPVGLILKIVPEFFPVTPPAAVTPYKSPSKPWTRADGPAPLPPAKWNSTEYVCACAEIAVVVEISKTNSAMLNQLRFSALVRCKVTIGGEFIAIAGRCR